jgi:hypothetical protein
MGRASEKRWVNQHVQQMILQIAGFQGTAEFGLVGGDFVT